MASLGSLRTLNIVAALLHTCLVVGFAVLFRRRLKAKDEKVDLYRLGINADNWTPGQPANSEESEINSPQKAIKDGSLNIRTLVLVFFAITAVAHTLYATDFFGAGWYSKAITQGWNPFRWIEYGLSASIMAALIAPFSGLRSSTSVSLVVASTAAMQGTGFLVERALIAEKPDFTAAVAGTIIGWLLLVTAWHAILGSFWSQLQDVNELGKDGVVDPRTDKPIEIPSFVWFIGPVQAAFFSSFGFVQLSEIWGKASAERSGTTFNFAGTETSYLVLSLAAKATLASVIAYGLIARNEDV